MNENSAVGYKPDVNVTIPERVVSAVAGGWLLYQSLKKGGSGRLIKALTGGFLLYRASTGNCPGYSAMGKKRLPDPIRNINIRATVVVARPRDEVYSFWRNLENLPLFMKHLESVEQTDGRHSHWKAKIPGGLGTIGWKAEIVKEENGEMLGWNSLPNATIENAGKVAFSDVGEHSTQIDVVITYRAPLGPAGAGVSKLLNPLFEKMVLEDVRNFKRYIETGNILVED